LEAAIEADAKFVPARLSLISLLVDEREYEAAGKLLQSTRKVAPKDLRVNYLDASLAYRQGELEKARQQVQLVLKNLPNHLPSLVLAGAIDLQSKSYTAAESSLRRAVARAPSHTGARQLLVQTYLRMGQPAKAKEALQPLIEGGMPADPRLQLLAGEAFLANGDVKRATEFYQAAAKAETGPQAAARTQLGLIALASGRSEEGFRELEAASELDAGAYQADLAIIAGHLRRKEYDRAMAAVKALEKKQPDNPLTFQMYGAVNLAKRDPEAARRSFEKALQLQPNYLPAAHGLAQLDVQAKKPGDAKKRYEAMIAADDKDDRLYLALAELQARTGEEPKVVGDTLQRAITANPQSVPARLALINFHLRQKDSKAALSAAQSAMAAMPSDPRILDATGVALEAAGEVNQAIETYNKLAGLQPQSAQPLLRLAGLHARQKNTGKAIDALRRAQKLAPNSRDVVPILVLVYLAGDRPDEALREVRLLQKREPKSAEGWYLEGDIYLAQRKFEDAARMYREALKLDPEAGSVAIKMHVALSGAGKQQEASAFAARWIAQHPKDAEMRVYLGDRELAANRLKAAASHFGAAVGIAPDNVAALNNLAWIGGELGDPKALGYAERALKLAPNSAAVLDTYGMLLVKKGEVDKGLSYLSRALTIAPGSNEIRLNYAKALIKAGKKEDARSELRTLQGAKENFKGKQEVAGLVQGL
jgi:putative PEP-CTERM system TPR-repeat lipoprotein